MKYKKMFMSFWLMALVFAVAPLLGKVQAAEKTYTNSVGMEFVLIPAGTFMMGSDKSKDKEVVTDETPQHQVTISKAFYLGRYAVTQNEWQAVMGDNPSNFVRPRNPVENVYWDDAQKFIKRLNQKEGHNLYRLPTEAEWEYAARAGTTSRYSFGDDVDNLGQYAWFYDNAGDETHPVGQLKPNAWGLYDMYGNVWEWVQDWYGDYSGGSVMNPRGILSGSNRVMRGGSWYDYAQDCSSASRGNVSPGDSSSFIGFRLVLSPE